MAKLTLNTIGSRYASVAALNSNFDLIETALENTLSRDGTTPNTMLSNLDMNGNSLVNVDTINGADASILEDVQAVVDGIELLYDQFDDRYLGSKTVEPIVDNDGAPLIKGALYFNEIDFNTYVWTGVEWRKFNELSIVREELTATEGQTVFSLSTLTYTPGINGIFVYIDGVRQFDTAYTETDGSTVTLSEGVPAGTKVLVESGAFSAGLILNNAAGVSCAPVGTLAATNVQAALQELDDEKFANSVSTSKLLGRVSGGTGVVEEIGLTSSGLSFSGSNLLISSIPSAATATTQAAGDNSTKVATTAYADAQKGTIIQIVEATPVTSIVTCSANIPLDDTIPQNTEGTQIITCTITPTSATSRLRIRFDAWAGNYAYYGITALFQDNIANALAATVQYENAGGTGCPLWINHEMAAGTTSAITFKIRVGPHAGTIYINGSGPSSRYFGGVSAARLSVMEVRA